MHIKEREYVYIQLNDYYDLKIKISENFQNHNKKFTVRKLSVKKLQNF